MRSIAMRHVLLCLTAPTQSTTETCLLSKSWYSEGTKTEQKPNNRQREPWRENKFKSQKHCSNTKPKQTAYIGTQILSTYCTIDIARTQNGKRLLFKSTQRISLSIEGDVFRASTSPFTLPFYRIFFSVCSANINLCDP